MPSGGGVRIPRGWDRDGGWEKSLTGYRHFRDDVGEDAVGVEAFEFGFRLKHYAMTKDGAERPRLTSSGTR